MPDPQLPGIAAVEDLPAIDYRASAKSAATAAGVDPDLYSKLIDTESSWNPNARSPKGAIGLAQLMPDTAAALGVDPEDPVQNLRAGAHYLASLLEHFGGDTRKAVAAYNAGPDAVARYGGVPPFKETEDYVNKILGDGIAKIEDLPGGPGIASIEDVPGPRPKVLSTSAAPPGSTAPIAMPETEKVNGVPTWNALRAMLKTDPKNPLITSGPAGLVEAIQSGADDNTLDTLARFYAAAGQQFVFKPGPIPEPDPNAGPLKPGQSIDPKTGERVTHIPLGQFPVLDAPYVGAKAAVRGATELGAIQTEAETRGTISGTRTLKAANDLMGGVMTAMQPVIAGSAVTAPVSTATALTRAWLASKFGEEVAGLVTKSEEAKKFAGNIAALASGTESAADLAQHGAVRLVRKAQETGRNLTFAVQMSGSGYGTGDVPGARGVPYAQSDAGAPPLGFQAESGRPAPTAATTEPTGEVARFRAEPEGLDPLEVTVALEREIAAEDRVNAPKTPPSSTAGGGVAFTEDLPAEFGPGASAGPVITGGQGTRTPDQQALYEKNKNVNEGAPTENLGASINTTEARPRAGEEAPAAPVAATPVERVASLPDGSKEGRKQVPFPVADTAFADKVIWSADQQKATLRDIPIADIVATQSEVNADTVLYHVDNPNARHAELPTADRLQKGALPRAVEWDGKFYLGDGTHRAVSEWAQGHDTVQAVVYPVKGGQLAEQPPSGKTFLEQQTPKPTEPLISTEAPAEPVVEEEEPIPAGTTALEGPAPTKPKPPAKPVKSKSVWATLDADYQQALLHGIGPMVGGKEAWQRLVRTGATDEQILDQARENFGISGGRGGPGEIDSWHKGGKNPSLTLNEYARHGRPKVELKGLTLAHTLRDALGIPLPGQGKGAPTPEPTEEPTTEGEEDNGPDWYYGEIAKGTPDIVKDAQAGWFDELPSVHWLETQSDENLYRLLDAMEGADQLPERVAKFGRLIARMLLEAAGQQRLPGIASIEEIDEGAEEEHGEKPTVAGGEEGTTPPRGSRGGRRTEEGESAGTKPRPERRPESGEGEGAGAGGTVSPGPSGPVGGGPSVRPNEVTHTATEPELYRITDEDAIGTGSTKERINRNFAAIRIVKQLAEEGRPATPEEQQALVRYVGWGGLSRIFEPWKNEPSEEKGEYWQAQFDTLKGLLTDEEFANARNSTQNAHYTSPTVINAIWQMVRRLGIRKGSALEPAAGIGHFLGLSPDGLRGLSWAAVEKDGISAAIAKALYPGAFVQHSPFEAAKLPANHFALTISNVPFGAIPITDVTFNPPFMKARIHNYYFGKALDYTAPGGLVAFITTQGTLDSRGNQKVREFLAARADLVAAIRLPFTAFKANAGTEVVTDIILLRKRKEGEAPNHASPWTNTVSQQFENKKGEKFEHYLNEYFIANPAQVLGTHAMTGKMRKENTYNVEPSGDLAKQLEKAVERLPKNIIDLSPPKKDLAAFTSAIAPEGTRPFEFLVHEGRLAQVNAQGLAEPVDVSAPHEAIIRAMLPIRTALRSVYDIMARDGEDAELEAAQAALTKAYDKFVKAHGPLTDEKNWDAFHEDPDLPLLLSLEDVDDERGTVKKTAVFTTRTKRAEQRARTASSPEQALTIALSETGEINLERIGELLNVDADTARLRLESAHAVIDTPEGLQLPAVYLAGNVRVKLVEAKAAAKLDPKYETAAKLLEAALPKTVPAHKINVRLGAPWVPPAMVQEFIESEGVAPSSELRVGYSGVDATWSLEGKSPPSKFETTDADTKTLLLDALNDRRRIIKKTVTDPVTGNASVQIDKKATALVRQRRDDIHRAFEKWLLTVDADRRKWAVETYNETFNAYVEPHVDGSYLTLPGMADYWRDHISGHQRDAIARVVQLGNTLFAHVVGAGKTLAMVASMMEMKRMGISRKPMMVVPNHLISQAPGQFLSYYPNAKVLVMTVADLASADSRKRITARIASGDWDAVILPYSAFVRVPVSAEAETAYQREILQEIELAILQAWAAEAEAGSVKGGRQRGRGQTPPSVKRLENIRDRIQARLKKLEERPKDDVLTFEQLGVDALFVDEAHSFKNLYFPTRQQAAGIPADNEAQRATDLYLKSRHINRVTNNRGMVLATGTPVSNSMAEVYVMQRLLQEQALVRAGVSAFDAWLAQFGIITTETELTPTGTGMAPRSRLKRFRNLPVLAAMFRQVADVKMIDDLPELKAKRPKLATGAVEPIEIPMSEEQSQLLRDLADRANNLDPRDRRADNMPKITTDGRLGFTDMRLLDRRRKETANSKIARVAKEVAAIHKENTYRKGTQIVFLDAGTPGSDIPAPFKWTVNDFGEEVKRPLTEEEKNRGFDLYADLKRKLVKAGVPGDQIAFIHDIDKVPAKKRDAARKALFRKVQQGQVRVLVGSTNKMGTGMNVQDRLVALHHVDPAWKPSDIEQRNGRILRQGNLFFKEDPTFEVRILAYLTQGQGQQFGFDAYMWQLNEAKASIINDFFSGDLAGMANEQADMDLSQTVATAAGLKALATGNPAVVELTKAEAELNRLLDVYAGWANDRREAEINSQWVRENVGHEEAEHAKRQWLMKAAKTYEPGTALHATIEGAQVEGHKNIGEAIFAVTKRNTQETEGHPAKLSNYQRVVKVGEILGLNATLERNGDSSDPYLVLRSPEADEPYYIGPNRDDEGEMSLRFALLVADPQKKGGLDWRNPVGLVNSIVNQIKDLDRPLSRYYHEKLAQYEAILKQKFEQQDELNAARQKVEELQTLLGQAPGVVVQEQEEVGGGGEEQHEMQVPAAVSVPLQTAVRGLQAAQAEIQATLSAPTVSQQARWSSRSLRQRLAEMTHTIDYAENALRQYRNAVEKMTVSHDEILDLADAIENPSTGLKVPKELQPWLTIRDHVYTYLKKQIKELGIERQWLDHYLGHVWEEQFTAQQSVAKRVISSIIGRRPLRGPREWMKHRTVPTMRQGVQRGLVPKTWNLVDIDLFKITSMAKFIAGQRSFQDVRDKGIAVFRSALKKGPNPTELVPFPDNIGEVWLPPHITVAEAYDGVLMEALESYVRNLGVQYKRRVMTGKTWGYSGSVTGNITMRFGSPEFVLMHELGHTLDALFGLHALVRQAVKKNMFEGETWTPIAKEMADLAKLRYQGMKPDPAYEKYVQKPEERIANLVHAYLHAPELAKKVAPHWYDAFDELVLKMPELEPLMDLQHMRSVVLGTREMERALPGPILAGRYYVPPSVARVYKNYLTPGLSANRVWALTRIPANALTQAKLVGSAFHAFVITLASASMKAADGITDVLRGKPAGFTKLAAAAIEPIAVVPRGLKIQKEWLGTLDPLTLAVDSATRLQLAGGGRIHQSREYTNRSLQKFLDSLRRANGAYMRKMHGKAGAELLGASLRLLPALVEASAWPILGWLVPAAKVGATTDHIVSELGRLKGAPTEETLRTIASKAVNVGDAMLGEVIWDNYFLPRALMSAVHMLIMAPGWRGGSAIVLARGLTDPIRRLFPSQREDLEVVVPGAAPPGAGPQPPIPKVVTPKDVLPLGAKYEQTKEGYWSPYTSILIAEVLIGVLVAELYQLAHGAGHVKSDLDVSFPRDGSTDQNGKPTRVRLPGYVGIWYDILRDMPRSIVDYALGGQAPLPTAIGQLYRNETYFGDEIIDKTDPWRVQLADYAKFLKDQFEPIPYSAYGRRVGTTAEKLESLSGISPAPARAIRTPLEQYLYDLQPPVHRTKDQAVKAQARRDYKIAERQGDTAAAAKATQEGGLSIRSLEAINRNLRYRGPQQAYQATTLPQAVRGYEIASPEERVLLRPILQMKLATQMMNVPVSERGAMLDRVRKALQLPVAAPARTGTGS